MGIFLHKKNELYSLDEFNEVCKYTPLVKRYMQNRFHATQNIDYSSVKCFLIQEVTNAKK
jgi:hypothetical protein